MRGLRGGRDARDAEALVFFLHFWLRIFPGGGPGRGRFQTKNLENFESFGYGPFLFLRKHCQRGRGKHHVSCCGLFLSFLFFVVMKGLSIAVDSHRSGKAGMNSQQRSTRCAKQLGDTPFQGRFNTTVVGNKLGWDFTRTSTGGRGAGLQLDVITEHVFFLHQRCVNDGDGSLRIQKAEEHQGRRHSLRD